MGMEIDAKVLVSLKQIVVRDCQLTQTHSTELRMLLPVNKLELKLEQRQSKFMFWA